MLLHAEGLRLLTRRAQASSLSPLPISRSLTVSLANASEQGCPQEGRTGSPSERAFPKLGDRSRDKQWVLFKQYVQSGILEQDYSSEVSLSYLLPPNFIKE